MWHFTKWDWITDRIEILENGNKHNSFVSSKLHCLLHLLLQNGIFQINTIKTSAGLYLVNHNIYRLCCKEWYNLLCQMQLGRPNKKGWILLLLLVLDERIETSAFIVDMVISLVILTRDTSLMCRYLIEISWRCDSMSDFYQQNLFQDIREKRWI